ncbi:MAG: hypothetical protein ACI93P_001839, partial [bacterium]
LTIYNDAIIEGLETIQMNFENGSEATDIRKQTLSIIDDDYTPAIGNGTVELLNETFDSSDTPADWFVSSEFDVNTWVFNGIGLTSFGRAYVVPTDLNPEEPTYNGTADSSIHLLSSPIDARGMTDVNVSFDWTAGGENDGTALFDWGEFMYTLDGVTYERVERFTNAGLPGSGTGPQVDGTFESLMPELDGKAFTLIWRWYNDALVQGTYSFSIDNVLVTGVSAPVEGDLAHSDNANVNEGSQVYFISDQDSDVIGIIENASADLGCVSLEVIETGFGGDFPNTIDGAISHAGKVISITADGVNAANATYDVTLYYTDSELSNFEAPNTLRMMKVNSSDVDEASDNPSSNYTVSGALLEENTDRAYRSYKGTFTGNGSIALVSTSEVLATANFNVSKFNVFPTLINNSESVTITNSKTFIENVNIYSINGKLIKSLKFKNSYNVEIPMAKLSAGMYFLNINNRKSSTHKFIVK